LFCFAASLGIRDQNALSQHSNQIISLLGGRHVGSFLFFVERMLIFPIAQKVEKLEEISFRNKVTWQVDPRVSIFWVGLPKMMKVF
jgi:hypothetical protein